MRVLEGKLMRGILRILLLFSILFLHGVGQAAAADGVVLGLSPDVDELELYKTPKDEDAAQIVGPGDLAFPTAILATSNNGMYKINHKGSTYWVISDDVKSDVTRKVDTACDPKMAGTVVAHGKRGAGEDCK